MLGFLAAKQATVEEMIGTRFGLIDSHPDLQPIMAPTNWPVAMP